MHNGTTAGGEIVLNFNSLPKIIVSQTSVSDLMNARDAPKTKPKNKCDYGPGFVAPDGGWGWLIMIAAGLSNLCCFPAYSYFGLVFSDRLKTIGLSTTEIMTIANINNCLSSCTGLANRPMFRRFTYRQVGLFSALLVALSMPLMMLANSFVTYVLIFSVLYGVGSGINLRANSLVLNTYFKERRRIAIGLAWTITGIGSVIMPQIVAVILPLYGVEGSLLLYTGLALTAAICSLFYHPVQWHVKKVEEPECNHITQKASMVECDQRAESIDHVSGDINDGILKDTKRGSSLWEKIVVCFDLSLLRDLSYVNLLVGITLGKFVEINFSLLIPFVLIDWDFSKMEIAAFMSMYGSVDIFARFLFPFVAGKIGWDNKTFFLMGLMTMAIGRVYITFFQSYWCIFAAFCWMGFGKGLRVVFVALVIPSYVPLDRLPAAAGLQHLFGGIFYLAMGPVVGYIRDHTNYVVTLHCLSGITYFVVASWTLEKMYLDYQKRKSNSLAPNEDAQPLKQFSTTTVTCETR